MKLGLMPVTAAMMMLLVAACAGETKEVPLAPPPEENAPASGKPGTQTDDGPPLGSSLDKNGSEGNPSDATGVTTAALSAAWCDQYARCNDKGARNVIMFYGGRDECIEHMEVENQSRMLLPGVLIGQKEIDACAGALMKPDACGRTRSYAECKWLGGVQDALPCNDDAQCQSGHCTARPGRRECGVCAPTLALGDNCANDEFACGVGLVCGVNTRKCEKRMKLGESCKEEPREYGCEDGLRCVQDDGVMDGHCKPLIPEGQTCQVLTSGIFPAVCARGLACIDGTCAKPPKYKKVKIGEACPAENAKVPATCAASICTQTDPIEDSVAGLKCGYVDVGGPAKEICR